MKQKIEKFWDHDQNLSVLLFLLVFVMFFLRPLSGSHPVARIILSAFFGLLLVSGVATIFARRRRYRFAAFLFVLANLLVNEISFNTESFSLLILNLSFNVAFFLLFIVVLLFRVFIDGSGNMHRVQGAIAAFLMIAFMWGHLYAIVALLIPGSFASNSLLLEGREVLDTMLYFSSITITTTGFGDVSPVHPIARALVTLEAYIGILFPGILIARLVSLTIQEKT